ncbi:guanylate-binding protein 2-like [Ruditapes philippinarum]|uniref:guanylate-binding protein 2-like n=1 Tax=Ruditapes philippinarum TaxID=129788 RepID=UPI00295B470B|nr:guanylate-binding protein 2-like [Ruditapes philippinarum]
MSDEIPQHILDIGFVFPTFVLCLRDFTLNIPENETPDTYFEKSLAVETDVKQTKTQEYNEIKKSILKHFPRRKCFVFGIPVSNGKILDRLEEVHESELSEDFRADTKKFLRYLLSIKPKKMFDGSSINGRMFASLTKKYTDSLANGKMPCIDDAFTTMAKQENELALEEAVGMC